MIFTYFQSVQIAIHCKSSNFHTSFVNGTFSKENLSTEIFRWTVLRGKLGFGFSVSGYRFWLRFDHWTNHPRVTHQCNRFTWCSYRCSWFRCVSLSKISIFWVFCALKFFTEFCHEQSCLWWTSYKKIDIYGLPLNSQRFFTVVESTSIKSSSNEFLIEVYWSIKIFRWMCSQGRLCSGFSIKCNHFSTLSDRWHFPRVTQG